MSLAPRIRELLERLHEAAAPFGRGNSEPRYAEACQHLRAIREIADWHAVPRVLSFLASADDRTRREAADTVARLAATAPARSMISFESEVASATIRTYEWEALGASDAELHAWPTLVWAVFTFHRRGYTRQLALQRLISEGVTAHTLPFVLLRLNDWVVQVRDEARRGVARYIDAAHAEMWLPSLALLEQLRPRLRADHTWLHEGVALLFLDPRGRGALEQALGSEDAGAARWALATAMKLADAERAPFLAMSLKNPDAGTRLVAAKRVKEWKACPDRATLRRLMARDAFMPVRREALYAALDDAPAERAAHLRHALLDRHAAMRHAARVYLRDDSVGAFDARAFYLSHVPARESGSLAACGAATDAACVAGLGESGTSQDAALLRPFARSRRSAVAIAAVRAVAELDAEGNLPWFVELLGSEKSLAAVAAARALTPHIHRLDLERLRELARKGAHAHTRRLALRLLLKRQPYDAIPDALSAAATNEAQLVQEVLLFVERFRKFASPRGPTDEQVAAARAAFRGASAAPAEVLARLAL